MNVAVNDPISQFIHRIGCSDVFEKKGPGASGTRDQHTFRCFFATLYRRKL